MKRLTLPLLLLSAGCAAPGFDDPHILIQPQIALLQFKGTTSMQSRDSGGAIQSNPEMSLGEFGAGARDFDWGFVLHFGDAFSGADFSFLNVDNHDSETGTLTSDWGALKAGDEVDTRIRLQEFRLRYIAEFFDFDLGEDDNPVLFELGAGASLVHRTLNIDSQQINFVRAQSLAMKDQGLPYIALRGRISYRWVGLEIDYGINPDISFGGDFSGVQQDLEVNGTFTFPGQDITVFGGYRRSTIMGDGTEGDFASTVDLVMDGFLAGVRVTF